MDQIKLGDQARDKISGFTGIVLAITHWLNGCVRITLAPQILKDGKPIESHSFDAEQVEVVKAQAMAAPITQSGGPSIEPGRAADPR